MSTENKKLRVLDLGAGASVYADQIRDVLRSKYGNDAVQVLTTGLRKKFAKAGRKAFLNRESGSGQGTKLDIESRLSKDDLKWRSIFELSDYPEFDLILDTYGERYYENFSETIELQNKKYFEAVCKKLLPGGLASIVPVPINRVALVEAIAAQSDCVIKYDQVLKVLKIMKRKIANLEYR